MFGLQGCGSASSGSDPGKVGGETNWLSTCEEDSDCSVGSCLCGICTRACDSPSSCNSIDGAVCSSEEEDAMRSACGNDYPTSEPLCVPELDEGPNSDDDSDDASEDDTSEDDTSEDDTGDDTSDDSSTDDAADDTSQTDDSPPDGWGDVVSNQRFDDEVWSAIWGSEDGELWVLGTYRPDPAETSEPELDILICDEERWLAATSVRRLVDDQWQRVEHPATTSMTAISGTSSADVWMVGLDGAAFHFDGEGWEPQELRDAEGLDIDTSDPCYEISLQSMSPNDYRSDATPSTDHRLNGYSVRGR